MSSHEYMRAWLEAALLRYHAAVTQPNAPAEAVVAAHLRRSYFAETAWPYAVNSARLVNLITLAIHRVVDDGMTPDEALKAARTRLGE
jgi:hypothetical protein